jgi:cysteine desulfurase
MLPYLREKFGNPSSIHRYGREAKAALQSARETVASFLSASAAEIVFTASGTESDNLAILGVLAAEEDSRKPRRHFVTSAIEHHAVLNVMRHLEKKGCEVTYLPVDRSGRIVEGDLRSAVRRETLLVSIMTANNETGVIQPIADLAPIAHEAGALFHTDAVQACGKVPVDVLSASVDLLSLSAHKFYGPKGVGALYVHKGTPFKPVLRGGGQERSRRPGTENVAGIVGLAEAAQRVRAGLNEESGRLRGLREELEASVLAKIEGSHLNGEGARRTPNTANFRFDGADGEELVKQLDRDGFAISTGAACSRGPSLLPRAHRHGAYSRRGQGSIRVSLGRTTRAEDVRAFADGLLQAVEASRASRSPIEPPRERCERSNPR